MLSPDNFSMENSGFLPSDFACDGLTEEEAKKYHTELGVSFYREFSFKVESTSKAEPHEVGHDGVQCISCPCPASTYGHFCKHMARGTLVLHRRAMRQKKHILEEKRTDALMHSSVGKPFQILR